MTTRSRIWIFVRQTVRPVLREFCSSFSVNFIFNISIDSIICPDYVNVKNKSLSICHTLHVPMSSSQTWHQNKFWIWFLIISNFHLFILNFIVPICLGIRVKLTKSSFRLQRCSYVLPTEISMWFWSSSDGYDQYQVTSSSVRKNWLGINKIECPIQRNTTIGSVIPIDCMEKSRIIIICRIQVSEWINDERP